MKSFITVDGEYVNEIVIEKSRFITTIKHIESEEMAKNEIKAIEKKNSFANHNCFAYRTKDSARFSDDKEPQGTAGLPILDVIKNNDITDVLIVVTRYFGGVKLGAGGLTRAYSKSASEAVKGIGLKTFYLCILIKLKVSYDNFGALNAYLQNNKILIKEVVYHEVIEIDIILKEDESEIIKKNLLDYMSARLEIIDKDKFFCLL